MSINLIYARETIPTTGPVVFLAGPTPRADSVPSWRPAVIDELARQWTGPGPLHILTPESRGGIRAKHYDDQFGWETAGRAAARERGAVSYWIPRDLTTLPGFTTNIEVGFDLATAPHSVVLGCPPDCPDPIRNRHSIHLARHCGATVTETIPDTVRESLAIARHRPSPAGLQ